MMFPCFPIPRFQSPCAGSTTQQCIANQSESPLESRREIPEVSYVAMNATIVQARQAYKACRCKQHEYVPVVLETKRKFTWAL